LTYGLLAVAALVLLVLDRPDTRLRFLSDFRSASDDIIAPVMSAVAAPFSGMRGVRESVENYWAVRRQNEELRTQIEELESWRALALSLRDKVAAYEAILDVPGIESLDPIVAWPVAESGGPFQHARLMEGGADKGIKPGYPVLTDRGLIGRVISVGDRSSRILLLTDAASRVPVMSEDGELRAMLVGDNTGAPKLEFADGARPLEPRERILTSGEGGVFQRFLPVGAAVAGRDGVWRVALYSNGEPTDAVWVYPYDPVEAPPPDAVTPVFPDDLGPAAAAGADVESEAEQDVAAVTEPSAAAAGAAAPPARPAAAGPETSPGNPDASEVPPAVFLNPGASAATDDAPASDVSGRASAEGPDQ
jgi:rod shape-determining protein MreC